MGGAGILLFGRKTVGVKRGHPVGIIHVGAGRAKIQQIQLLVPLAQHQVIGLDIPMDDILLVQFVQGIHHRGKQIHGVLHGNLSSMIGHILPQGLPLYILHHDIGGVVRQKGVKHAHHVGDVVQRHQRLGLGDKLAHAGHKIRPLVAAHGRNLGASSFPGGDAAGEIFLNGYPPVQRDIIPQIGDAKAALSQAPANQILIPDDGKLELRRAVFPMAIIMPAVWADSVRLLQGPHA